MMASGCPTEEHLTELHRFLADRYQFSPHDLLFFARVEALCVQVMHKSP